jgi:hypothetical protein
MKDYTYLVLVIKSLNYDDLSVPNGNEDGVEGIEDTVLDEPVGNEVLVDDTNAGVTDGVGVDGVGVDGGDVDGVTDDVTVDDNEVVVFGVVIEDVLSETLLITLPETSFDKTALLLGIPKLYPTYINTIGTNNNT